jgi:hypothetical protein
MALEGFEARLPQAAVAVGPVGDFGQRFRAQAIEALAAAPLLRHQLGFVQDSQMLGDRRAARGKAGGERVDRRLRRPVRVNRDGAGAAANPSAAMRSRHASHAWMTRCNIDCCAPQYHIGRVWRDGTRNGFAPRQVERPPTA